MAKVYTITMTPRGRSGFPVPFTGTVDELVDALAQTLESGNRVDPKINLNPKSAKGLVAELNKAVAVTQSNNAYPDCYQLTTV